MRKIFTIALMICALHCIAQQSSQQPSLLRGDKSITMQSIKEQVQHLAADSLEGRLAGTKGAHTAADFLCAELRKSGYTPTIQPFADSLQNILCKFDGADTSLVVIVGAHYDHLGVDSLGDVYNGADDNASGVAAVLQIAHAFRASRLKPAHTVVFALWDGEEKGLRGSKYFVKNCIADSSKVLYYMNFDMIGRDSDPARPQQFSYMYTERTPHFRLWLADAINIYSLRLKPDYSPWDNPISGSDNANFARRGIPIVWYHTGGHPDYHKVTDTPEKLNWDKLLDIIRSAYFVAWQMAQ